ncbi:MAG TPA: radical SAM protein, partial [bacterium]|nr:radical SAM protein [bacterium]
ISLDGLEEVHDRVRGVPGTFKRAVATLQGLVELSRAYPRLKPTAKFTIMRDNYDQLLPVYELAREMGVEFTTKPASEFGFTDNLGDKSYIFTPGETREIIDSLRRITASQQTTPLQHGTFMHRLYRQAEIIFHTELIGYMDRTFIKGEKVPASRCFSSSISILVHFDGKVYNCPTLLRPMGDLTVQSLDEIWYGPTMRKMRRFIAQGRCACYSQCDLMPALVLGHKFDLIRGLIRTYPKPS